MTLDDSSSFKSGKFKGFWAGVVAMLVGRLLPKSEICRFDTRHNFLIVMIESTLKAKPSKVNF